ncbi:sugar transferase [Chamaesiphon sp. VAR_69_metabat_338]|uniref:sugar transferase n=1 Tax=Chamaesiphon sp. VAR_69_metabat_338 TaxID=2964704 RepID=UPI00286DDE44|nr:sugar transferase [Chamaesiphon sp. VAR_69_metabat_338]
MTDLKKNTPTTSNLWQTEDIRAMQLSMRWRTPIAILRSIVMLGLDALMLYGSWTIADRIGIVTSGSHLALTTAPIVAITIGTLAASGFYGTDDKLHRFAKLFKALTLAQVVILIAAFFYQPGLWWVSRLVFIIAWLLNFVSIGLARFLFDSVNIQLRKHYPIFKQSIVLVGHPEDIEKVRKLLDRSQQFRIDSTIDLSVWDIHTQLEQMIARIRARKVSEVFICSQQLIDNQIILFWNLKAAGIHLRMVPTDLQLPQRSAEIKMIEEIPTVRFKSLPIFGISFWLKRIFDLTASSILLIVLSPLLITIAIVVNKTSSGSIFYKQDRVGLKGHRFKVWKFRTMVANANELQQALEAQNEVKGGVLFKIKEDPRITKVGKFLRKYSLDELPQLFNVLQGQMSLVGPRPLAIRDYELSIQNTEQFTHDRFLRYEVLPGVTGLWQVKGRASTDSEEIFYWDMVYILQWSLALDVKILLATIKVVLLREGSY